MSGVNDKLFHRLAVKYYSRNVGDERPPCFKLVDTRINGDECFVGFDKIGIEYFPLGRGCNK